MHPQGHPPPSEPVPPNVSQPAKAQRPGQKAPLHHPVQLCQEVITPVTPFQVNLEDQVKEMFLDPFQSPVLLVLGQKGGGKSFRMMTILMWLLRNDVFDQYYLVLPTFGYEANNSYMWLEQFKDRVFVSTQYTPEITQAFLQRPDDKVPPEDIPRCFMWLDDVGMNDLFRNDPHFVGLLSVVRHKRLSVCICYHSLTSGQTLSPFLRQNVTHTLLFRVTNEKLLESIYEELVSMTGHFQRFREFKQTYNQHTCSEVNAETGEVTKNYNGLCINNSLGCIDWNLGQWLPEESDLLKIYLDKMKKAMTLIHKVIPTKLKEVTPQIIQKPLSPTPPKKITTSWEQSIKTPIKTLSPEKLPLFLSNPHYQRPKG